MKRYTAIFERDESGAWLARARCREAEALQDPARVVGREVGAIEARGARQDLLRRKTTARHHDGSIVPGSPITFVVGFLP